MSKEGISQAELEALQGLLPGDPQPSSQPQQPVEPKAALPAVFPPVAQGKQVSAAHASLGILKDVQMEVTVVLGKTQRKIGEILEMGPGSVLELERLAGEAVDVVINNKCVAKGEVVVIDENFGIRITEIIKHGEGGTE